MKLNKRQKLFLFENCYVTAKVLDACIEKGWQDFYIKYYDWKLDGKDQWGFDKLYLIDNGKSALGEATKGALDHQIGLNFQGRDYNKLLKLGKPVKKKA